MQTLRLVTIVGAALVLSGMGMSAAAAKNQSFVNKVGCYAAMKVKCTANGGTSCSDEEYNESIEWCDATFAVSAESESSEKLKTANGVLKLLFKR